MLSCCLHLTFYSQPTARVIPKEFHKWKVKISIYTFLFQTSILLFSLGHHSFNIC